MKDFIRNEVYLVKPIFMKKFKEGDNLTLEDVKTALKEAHDKNIKAQITEPLDKRPYLSTDGFLEFESWDEYKKVFGDFVSLEETFSGGPEQN